MWRHPQANDIVAHILQELQLHINYCKSFGVSVSEMQAMEERQGTKDTRSDGPSPCRSSPICPSAVGEGRGGGGAWLTTFAHIACTAYTRYVLDVGQSEDWLALQVALAPCLLGYGAVAQMLDADPKTRREGNTYWPWIQNYVADDYARSVKLGSRKAPRPPDPCGHDLHPP